MREADELKHVKEYAHVTYCLAFAKSLILIHSHFVWADAKFNSSQPKLFKKEQHMLIELSSLIVIVKCSFQVFSCYQDLQETYHLEYYGQICNLAFCILY